MTVAFDMPNSQLPVSGPDFWWLRYGLGVAVPIALAIWGAYSIATLHSYAIWCDRYVRGLDFVKVNGEQAVLMGIAYWGVALAFFASCYAQYHYKMGFYYQWLVAPGVILAIGGVLWCSLIFLLYPVRH